MDEADPRAKLEPFQALIGEWTIEMTHPMVEDTVVRGRATYEWPFVAAGSGRDGLQGLFGSHLLGRGAERLVSVGTTILACTTARTGPDERLPPVLRRVLPMTVTIPSLPRRRVDWWAISACIVGVVFVLRGAVGFFVPGIDYPHPTLAQQVPVLVAGTTSPSGPRVGRVKTDERTRLTVSARASVRCRRRPRGARR